MKAIFILKQKYPSMTRLKYENLTILCRVIGQMNIIHFDLVMDLKRKNIPKDIWENGLQQNIRHQKFETQTF